MSGKALELFDCVENVNKFENSSAKEIKFSENLCFAEVKCFSFGHISNFVFGFFIAIFVFFIKSDTR